LSLPPRSDLSYPSLPSVITFRTIEKALILSRILRNLTDASAKFLADNTALRRSRPRRRHGACTISDSIAPAPESLSEGDSYAYKTVSERDHHETHLSCLWWTNAIDTGRTCVRRQTGRYSCIYVQELPSDRSIPPPRQSSGYTAAPGSQKDRSTVRTLGIEVNHAIAIAEQVSG
jgi:hypothetical protein